MNRRKRTAPIIYFIFIFAALAISIAIAAFVLPPGARFAWKVIIVGFGTVALTFVAVMIHGRIKRKNGGENRRR